MSHSCHECYQRTQLLTQLVQNYELQNNQMFDAYIRQKQHVESRSAYEKRLGVTTRKSR